MSFHPNNQTESIRIPRQQQHQLSSSTTTTQTILSSNSKRNQDDLKIVKTNTLNPSNQNSFNEQRLASSITNYLYSSLSPPSPTSYKLNDFKCSESFKESQLSNLLSFNKRISSAYIPDDEVQKIYSEIYSNDAQIDDITRLLSFHPNFCKEFQKFNNYLMYSQGALSYESRHYLAIMAASRHKCYYLVNQQENEFLSIKGNKKWLTSQDNLPQKLRDLFELNNLLCHQPWLINRSHIENLLKNEYSNQWSITELIMAATILSHFHALAGLVYGLGINENFLTDLAHKHQLLVEENELRKKQQQTDHNNNMTTGGSQNEDLSMFDEEDEDEYDCCVDDFNQENTFEFSDLNDNLTSTRFSNINNNDKLNRTMSNSSASSCEIGIEMLLKEMQMIQADDKLNEDNKLNSNSSANLTNTSISMSSTITNMQSIAHSNNSNTRNTLSGTNTISNSPISSSLINGNTYYNSSNNYLTDSSNCSSPKYSHSFNAMHHHAKRLLTVNHRNQLQSSRCSSSNANNENENDEDSDLDCSNTAKIIDDDTKLFNYQLDESESFNSTNPSNKNAFNKNSHKLIYKYKKIKSNKYSNQNVNNMTRTNNTLNSLTNLTAAATATNVSNNSQLNSLASLNSTSTNYLSLVRSQTNNYMMKYLYDPDFTRINFKYADQSLRLEFFTWERQGFSTASSIYSDICDLLDRKFRVAATMTYNTMGCHNNVDTSLFRRAIWLYIQSLFGVRYDDYDYKQIKQLMGSPLRNYIKILCSCPERVTKKDYEKIMKEFTHSEKILRTVEAENQLS